MSSILVGADVEARKTNAVVETANEAATIHTIKLFALRDKHVVGPDGRVSLADLARQSQVAGGGMIAHGTFIAPATAYDTKRVEGHAYPAFHSPSFHAHAVDLSVDEETGEVTIHKYVVAQDVGFALNPTYIEGQIEGGVAQGLGQTLSEEIVYREGRVLNANLTDYKMPTALDVPRIESIIVEHPGLIGPYGAKAVGEPPNVEPPATVANAIDAAMGDVLATWTGTIRAQAGGADPAVRGVPGYGVFETADGRYVTLAGLERQRSSVARSTAAKSPTRSTLTLHWTYWPARCIGGSLLYISPYVMMRSWSNCRTW
jgi:xanthine dehydrogenase molybdopterin-binding subunit B